jgi:hypothetical protein
MIEASWERVPMCHREYFAGERLLWRGTGQPQDQEKHGESRATPNTSQRAEQGDDIWVFVCKIYFSHVHERQPAKQGKISTGSTPATFTAQNIFITDTSE